MNIKEAISSAPIQASLNYSKDCILFSFASNETIVGVLLQKNMLGNKQSISLQCKNLDPTQLKYYITKKQGYALVASLKHFETYIGYSKIQAFVPCHVVKYVLSRHDGIGDRSK